MEFSKSLNLEFKKIGFSPLIRQKICTKPSNMVKNHQKLQITLKNSIWGPLLNSKTKGSKILRQSRTKIIGQICFSKQMLRPTGDSKGKLLNPIKELCQLIYMYRRTQDLGLWIFGLMRQKPISHGMATWSPDLQVNFAFSRFGNFSTRYLSFPQDLQMRYLAKFLILAIILSVIV